MTLSLPFIKAQAIGNDFVIIQRDHLPSLTHEQLQFLAHRRYGIGCDQIIFYKAREEGVDVQYFNADGSEAESCGNGARALATLLLQNRSENHLKLLTKGGVVQARRLADGQIETVMDMPAFLDLDLSSLPSIPGQVRESQAVSVGNPHLIYFVDNVVSVPIAELGAQLECHALFPNRVNVSFVEQSKTAKNTLIACVWERGVGLTEGCGTAACATAFVAHRLGEFDAEVLVAQPGGVLTVDLSSPDQILLRGKAEIVFTGVIELS